MNFEMNLPFSSPFNMMMFNFKEQSSMAKKIAAGQWSKTELTADFTKKSYIYSLSSKYAEKCLVVGYI